VSLNVLVLALDYSSQGSEAGVLGPGALANKATHGELKSMFVSRRHRGKRVAQAILRDLEERARDAGLPR
jgi:GNAT superfamily N-acetyltransferase